MTTLDADPEVPAAILDRTISPIAGRFSSGRGGKAVVFGGLLVGCAAFAAMSWSSGRAKPVTQPDQPARQVVAYEPAPAPTLSHPGATAPSLTGDAEPVVPALAPETGRVTSGGGGARPSRAASAEAIRSAPLMAYSRGGAGARESIGQIAAPLRSAAPALTELEQLRRGSAIGQIRAHKLGDRSYLLLAGSSLPCVLQTAMDTATPGYVTCVIPRDVYSDNGALVLLEKGTKVLGEYRSSLRQGQARLFVLWTRAVTPAGVAIDLASPATDSLGRAGFDGDIDRHFWDRFGGALLLSIVDDGSAALSRSGAGETARLPSDAAGIAVQHSFDLPPTLRKAQGSEVAILAAQDFDFSDVYGLRSR